MQGAKNFIIIGLYKRGIEYFWTEPLNIMNINEECLLLFLNNPGRLEFTTKELKKVIFSLNNNIILTNDNMGKKLKLSDV